MDIHDYILSTSKSQLNFLFNIAGQVNVYNIAVTIAIAAIVFAYRLKNAEHATLKEFVRFLLPRETYLHPSAKFDYFYFVFCRFVKIPVFILAGLASIAANDWVFRSLNAMLGPPAPAVKTGLNQAMLTVTIILVIDFAYWAAHWAMHRNTWLWEFHKGHHSAEVLAFATVNREHPLEEVLFAFAIYVPIGVTFGVFDYFYGVHTRGIELWGTNVIVLFFNTFLSNLRHTHIWLPVKGIWGRIIHSPGHHHIHHSTQPRHYNKNLSLYLSVWDWVFGTLYIPTEDDKNISFGIGEESTKYHRFIPFMVLPFKNILLKWRLGKSPDIVHQK